MLAMQSTADEAQKAAIGAQQVQTQVGVQIDQDALASASLIYGAIKHLDASVELTDGTITITAKELCIRLATKLSYNTLLPWYKGAALMVGERAHLEEAFKSHAGDTTWVESWWKTGKAEGSEKLKALRRTYGNGWQGALAAGTFVQRTQLAKQRDENWNKLPGLSSLDHVAGVGPPS